MRSSQTALLLLVIAPAALAFAPPVPLILRSPATTTRLYSTEEMDEVDRELAKAKVLLAEAKQQIAVMDAIVALVNAGEEQAAAAAEEEKKKSSIPFFASLGDDGDDVKVSSKRDIVMKSTNDDGLITVNGDEMAKLSEEEMWSTRSLGEVFENELNEDEDVYATANKGLRTRDVAASIYNLRKTMQMGDYQKIFDKSNYFIGEDV
jgi:hypothetical protein